MHAHASVNYHVKCQHTQAFHFDVDGIAGNLLSPELHSTEVAVEDIRGKTPSLNFAEEGIAFINHTSSTPPFNHNTDWQTPYNSEISELLRKTIGAKEVIVFDHTLRVDDGNAQRKPARNVHNDYSPAGANQRLIDLVGNDRAAEYRLGAYAFVNVWRPIEHPITSSPLGFIHPRSMEPEDWMTIELRYPERLGQILGVAANPRHKWFYQSNMTPNEVIIFNIYDNRGRPHLAHSALDITGKTGSPLPRKSIETRTLIRY